MSHELVALLDGHEAATIVRASDGALRLTYAEAYRSGQSLGA